MLEWNVYISDFNEKRIETYNIFLHYSFMADCQKIVKKYVKIEKSEGTFDRCAFAEEVRRSLMYYFWSKCEWEIILSHWPPRKDAREEKIDVYDQVRLNWDTFIDYLWSNKDVVRKWKG